MLSDIKPPEFGWIRLAKTVRVSNPHLCQIEAIQSCDILDGRSLDQHAVPEITTPRRLFVRVRERLICHEEIDGWASRAVYAMSSCREERPAIAAAMPGEI